MPINPRPSNIPRPVRLVRLSEARTILSRKRSTLRGLLKAQCPRTAQSYQALSAARGRARAEVRSWASVVAKLEAGA